MTKSQFLFFATESEQRQWLQRMVCDARLWCVARQFPPTPNLALVEDAKYFDLLDFHQHIGVGIHQIFLGLREITASPIWSNSGIGGRDIDFTRSQAIQYVPSLVVGERVLLSGQIAIMRDADYSANQIDPAPIKRFFSEVRKDFTRLSAPHVNLVCRDSKSGDEKVLRNDIVTSGAVDWKRSGRVLKQFEEGAYEFHVT